MKAGHTRRAASSRRLGPDQEEVRGAHPVQRAVSVVVQMAQLQHLIEQRHQVSMEGLRQTVATLALFAGGDAPAPPSGPSG